MGEYLVLAFGHAGYRIRPLRKRTYGTFLIGQSAPFLIHPSPIGCSIQIRSSLNARNNTRKALDRESLIYRQPPTIRYPPGSQLSRICTRRYSLYSQGFSCFYRHSRRRLGSPWVGPINAALRRFKLPDATSTLSTSSAPLFLCWCSDAFRSFFTHAAINLQPPSRTVLRQTPGSSAAAVLQSPVR